MAPLLKSPAIRLASMLALGSFAAPASAPAATHRANIVSSTHQLAVGELTSFTTDPIVRRLNYLEQRIDRLAEQNRSLQQENETIRTSERIALPLTMSFSEVQHASQDFLNEDLQRIQLASRASGDSPKQSSEVEPVGLYESERNPPLYGDQSAVTWEPAESSTAISTGGGRSDSLAAGGDPTSVGSAQEIGNRHLGQVPLNAFYDFDAAGFHLQTPDKEYSIGVSGMTQIDAMVYDTPPPGVETSSGLYNPRSRIYFEGHASQPLSWEFSLQNFYDSVNLLDAYLNVNYDPRFQVQIGRYKNPFTYEFFRMHIWDLMSPERSLFATNYEANRRFGLMGHGVLDDERIEYALGTFNTQRNSFRAFDNRQDFQAFLNFKPFYPEEGNFLLRNLQFGGSIDVGHQNQPVVPAVLRANSSPGGEEIDSSSANNSATTPFLAFNPGVMERGDRALWEAHLANYFEGFSFVAAIDGGHESYAQSPAMSGVRVPIDGWFVQGGYLLTGETIRDRTNIQPLTPLDFRKNRFGLGAWEVTARYSELSLDERVFSAGLADPQLWTNDVKMVDVGTNWYLNQFVKIYFDWEHAMFADPVITTAGTTRRSSDLFWMRTQIFF